jgi:hypothetical protein
MRRRLLLYLEVLLGRVLVLLGAGLVGIIIGVIQGEFVGDPAGSERRGPRR